MKLLGRIVAAVLAGVIAVLTVQQVIRRVYHRFGNRYFQLPTNNAEDLEE